MASRSRQRVQTGRVGGTPSRSARAPPSAHLKRATSAAKELLRSSSSSSNSYASAAPTRSPQQRQRPGVKKPVARMPEVDLTDLQNEFFLPEKEQHWNKNAATARDSPARSLEELKQKRERQRRPMVHKAVDIDGDGVVDDVEIELSKILDTIEGEDLDGDGIVTEEELMQTKIKKGKEILARRFVESNPAIHNFWTDFRGMDNEAMVKAICSNVDYRMLMSNLTNKAMQFEMLYDSRRIGDSLRIMATDRDRRWQQKKAQIAENRNKLFQAKYNATVNAHRQSKVAEREHELRHAERKRQSFTPLLKGTSLKQRPTH